MRRRILDRCLLPTGAAILALAAACSAGGTEPKPRPSYDLPGYEVIITQCMMNRHLVPAKYLHPTGSGDVSQWFSGGRVIENGEFAAWWRYISGAFTVAGKIPDQWAYQAVQDQKIPAQVCGSPAMPSPAPSLEPNP